MDNENQNPADSQETEGAETNGEAQDPIKNLKAEVSRKLSNTETRIQQMLAQQAELNQRLADLAASQFKPQTQTVESDEIDVYDPKSVQRAIDRRVASEANKVKSEVEEQNRQHQVLAQLAAEYPELQDGQSELSLAAVRQFQALDPKISRTAAGYKLAVREAAAEIGLVPLSKRKAKVQDSSFTGLGGSASSSGQRPTKKAEELEDHTVEIARLMGIDTGNKKVMDSIKKRAQRKNWSRYDE